MDIYDKVESIANKTTHGKVFIEMSIAENRVVSANVAGATSNKKYKTTDNIQQGSDLIKYLRKLQDQDFTGDTSITISMVKGLIRFIHTSENERTSISDK